VELNAMILFRTTVGMIWLLGIQRRQRSTKGGTAPFRGPLSPKTNPVVYTEELRHLIKNDIADPR
jgi:hypothetical protein